MALQQTYDPYYLPMPQVVEYVYDDLNAINTLFVSGLPDDVKAREIHNLFRRRPGFESCQLKYTGRGNQVVGFATFVNHPSAMAALHELNEVDHMLLLIKELQQLPMPEEHLVMMEIVIMMNTPNPQTRF